MDDVKSREKLIVPHDEEADERRDHDDMTYDERQVRVAAIDSTMFATRQWHYSLCVMCQDMPSCLEAMCCTRCQMSRQYNALYNNKWRQLHWPLCLVLTLCEFDTFPYLHIILNFLLRQQIRQRYNIQGTDCEDFLAVLCCSPCAVQQHMLEMTSNNEFPGATCYNVRPTVQLML